MTRAEQLFFLLSDVDDALIEEAVSPIPRQTTPIRWKRWAALAACLLLVLAAPHLMPRMGSFTGDAAPMDPGNMAPAAGEGQSSVGSGAASDGAPAPSCAIPGEGNYGTDDLPNLPLLSASCQFAEGSGGSGIWIAEIGSYQSEGLWFDGPPPDTLPVYEETLEAGLTESSTGVLSDPTAMEACLDDFLSRFGADQTTCQVTRYNLLWQEWSEDEPLAYLNAVFSDGSEVCVSYDLMATISLSPERLSDEIRNADRTTFEGMEALGQAVTKELDWLLCMDTPIPAVTGGDVDLYGEPIYQLHIYDGGYPLRLTRPAAYQPIWTTGTSADTLVIQMDGRAGRELVGEYPIITPEEAEEQLLSGSWVGYNENWYTIPTADQILRSHLVYCTNLDGYTMPYYRFYLDFGETIALQDSVTQLPTGETVSMLEFYYVPAVEVQYLTSGSAPVGNQ